MSLEEEIRELQKAVVELTQALRLNTLKDVGVEKVEAFPEPPIEAAPEPSTTPAKKSTPAVAPYDKVKDAFLGYARSVGAPSAREWLEGHGWKTLRDAPAEEYTALLQELSV